MINRSREMVDQKRIVDDALKADQCRFLPCQLTMYTDFGLFIIILHSMQVKHILSGDVAKGHRRTDRASWTRVGIAHN